ncbi:Uncharacterized protein YfaL [Stylophora pistillata]|uniref:Uncharacterized protein YfaL n=1 Tax=Stylophora pistillata TaxID=50429 RepID=A0A2B4SJN1_STYPI|nr:Uncharacterized protein YfaL [Stylophora pistillata]
MYSLENCPTVRLIVYKSNHATIEAPLGHIGVYRKSTLTEFVITVNLKIAKITFYIIGRPGRDSKTKNFYTSRAKGNDNWSCDQTEPCQTIWRAVSLASDGDVVYLDGTGTGKNPYSCHSTQNLGVYINKRLALIGTGPMLPQIRCSEGTSLTFNGSGNASQMNVTLSGLLVSDSLVYFHDLSVNIYGCQFIGSKHGVKFVMSNREVSDIVITDSNFFGNKECISVFVTGSRIGSPIIKQNLILKNSSMSGNTIADGGNFISLTESPDNNKTVNCFIAMETVTFSGNTYNSRGLVYLQFKNGDQYFRNHKVISMNNRPSSNKEVLLDLQRNSEFMFECQNVTISINSSNFISQNARTLNVSATNILLQISNSRFSVHRLARYGGVVSLRGSSECELKISNSSFINNTVILDNGGAIEAECTKVRCTLTSSTFTDNTAVNGNGGAVKLRVFSSSFNYLRKENDNKDNDLVVLVRNVTFNNCSALSGGALSIVYERRHHGVVSISNCLFISNGALAGKEPLSGYGGAIQVRPATDDKLKEKHSNINVIIGGSIFTNNTAVIAGGAIYVKVTDQSNVIIEKSEIEWSSGLFGGCTIVGPTSSLKILDCTFANNLANALAIFHNVKNVEIIDSSFVGNYPLSGSFGGALVISDSKKCEQEQLQQGSYAIIQNTTFKSNIAVNSGGAVYLANCKTNIRNCQFFNNFAPRYGAHVYALKTNSLAILDSIYMQTRNKPRLINGKNYSDHSSLIDIVDIETLVVYNTTVEVKAYSRDKALMMVTSIVGKVDLGNENFAAEFTCPVGSEIKINCMPGILNTPDRPCKSHRNGGGVSSIQLRCSVCEGNSYSLERGRAKGTQLVSPVQCHPCPFGADCTKNIVAKRDFWGFKEQQNSSLLRFTMCPMGYCSQPKEADFPEFNSCQGNRSGKLCGECKDNYVETLYSTQCIPSHWCNDYWFWPVALIYVFVMALYLTFRPPVVPWIKRQILWFKQNEPVGQDVNFEKGYMKILFYFYQAANLVLISGSSQLAIKDKIVQPLLGAFNFRSGFLQEFNCPFTGLTVVTEQLFLASHVVCTLLVICALYGVLCGFQRFRGKGNPSPGPYVGGILQTTLLGYTVIATKSFSLLRCVDIGGERQRASKATNFYISRASGNDSWSCVQTKPCKTIWQAVSLASDGDIIYLDGTKTDQDPFNCQSAQNPGLNINTSLALIGTGPMPPQIRCSEKARLSFDGSRNVQGTNVTLSGLIVKESLVFFQDTSVNIFGCIFLHSKQGVQFVIRRKVLSDFLITSSVFDRNKECISVFINTAGIDSSIIQLNFTVKNSSMSGNTIADGGNVLTFTESLDNNQTVNCFITMKGVTLFENRFSTRGLFFLHLKNGNLSFELHEVRSFNNRPPSPNFSALKDHLGDSEFFINSVNVAIVVDASNFTSKHARAFCSTSSNISLQVHNSSFTGHHVKGNGGVVYLKGSHECKLNISNSSFLNTTVDNYDRTGGGGAIFTECVNVRCTLKDSTFVGNKAVHNGGAAINLCFVSSGPYNDTRRKTLNLSLLIEKVLFRGCRGFASGSLQILYGGRNLNVFNGVINIRNSRFSHNSAKTGGAISVFPWTYVWPRMCSNFTLAIERSNFDNNTAVMLGGALYFEDMSNNTSSFVLDKVIMESNRVTFPSSGVLELRSTSSVKVLNSSFLTNEAHSPAGAFSLYRVDIIEITDSLFVSNFAKWRSGGALSITEVLNITIKNTIFERNFAIYAGGALFLDTALIGANVLIINCSFVDNLALSNGGHTFIYSMQPSLSVLIQNSVFTQTKNRLQLSDGKVYSVNFSSTDIAVSNAATVVISNTTVKSRAYSRHKVLMVVSNSKKLELGNGSLTTNFICPVGSIMDILCISKLPNGENGVDFLQFKCSACEGNSYSLQRGRSKGTQLVSRVLCHPCPFGANCSQNIVAKRDFWGFREQQNPSQLRLATCPMGYCSQPTEADFPEYNSCQVNRSGQLCGKCNYTELYGNYTESLYSTECIPSHWCNDYWFWPVALIYGSLMALYLTFRPPVVPWIKRQILWFRQSEQVDEEVSFNKGYLKILFYFYQAANLFLISGSAQLLIKDRIVEPIVGIFNFKSSSLGASICPFPGLTPTTKRAVSENAPPSQDSRRHLEMVLYDCFKRPEEGSNLSLCWESVMIARRLVLAALQSLVSDPLPRIVIMNLLSVLFLAHHIFSLPFRDVTPNIIETISLAFIVVLGSVNVYFASFVSLGVSIDDTHFSYSWLITIYRSEPELQRSLQCAMGCDFKPIYVLSCLFYRLIGRVSKATNIYISRASGNDSWSCVQRKPCKTIWRGVSLASDRDAIYLDGTNTDQDPYSCHSTQHLGVYINKRLALIGTGPIPPQIRCSEGTRLTFDGSENTHQMNVTLSGLLVRESFIFFQDTSASIHGCKFVGSKQGVQFVIRRKMVSDFLITNSAFDRNEECISVFVNGTKIESPIIQKKYLLVLSIDNVSFSNCSGTYGSLSFVKVEENPLEGVIDIGNSHFISNVGGAIVIKSLANEMHSNISVMIRGSTFANNRVEQEGGIIFITRKLENSVVLENTIIKSNRGGGIEVRRSSLLKVLSCTFANNTGSAVSIVDVGILEINDTLFVKNDISFGPYGAVLFITTGRNCEYINIKYTTFRGNVAEKDDVAVIIFECNCTTEIRNSYFLDNFTQLFVEETSTLLIQDSIFNQTLNMKYPSSPSLIEIVNLGNLVLSNTTVATEAYSRDKVLMRVNSGNKVSLGNDSFPTKFICPFGSKITIDCYGGSPSFDPDSCTDYIDARITAIKFKCSACEGDSYSLQGGKANGAQVVSSVKCHRCPFGANCSQNIVAKHNFWGFKEERNSSLLRFTMCPVGYCNKTTEADFPEFNSCQGNRNRSGQLCGKCKVNYTETLYSTQCIPLHWCNDYWFWPVALIYVSLLALYLTFRPSVVPWIKRQILWFKENERVSQEVYFDKGYLKILFYFYQVANLFLVSGSSQMLIKDKIVEPIVGIFNFKSTYVGVSICPFPGLTPVNKSTKIESPIIHINFSLTNSSMFDNTIEDGGNHLSFTESPDNDQTVIINCLISMESVTFAHNKFSSRGLVFLQFKSGNQGLQLHEVNSSDNWPSTNKDVLKDLQGDGELVLNSTYVDIFINASSFTSQNTRELCVTASNTSIQIWNSRFYDHRVEGGGGALSVKGYNECRLFIVKSSFFNTTAVTDFDPFEPDGGGAIEAECAKLTCTLKNSIFSVNTAVNGSGGAVALGFFSSSLYDIPQTIDKKDLLVLSIENVSFSNCSADYGGSLSFVKRNDKNPFGAVINISNSHFISNEANHGSEESSVGGAILIGSLAKIMHINISVMIRGSTFVNNAAEGGGGAIFIAGVKILEIIDSFFVNNHHPIGGSGGALFITNYGNYCEHIIIKNTTFTGNFAREYGGAVRLLVDCKTEFRNSYFLDNFALFDGAHIHVEETSSLLIQDSNFTQTTNTTHYNYSSLIEVIKVVNLVLTGTRVATEAYSRDKVLMRVRLANQVSLGSDSSATEFICPSGSKIDIDCLPDRDESPCTLYVNTGVTAIQFKCSACEGNSYSLQGGRARGTMAPRVQCHSCPYGANCTQNIVAKRDFWGFKEQRNPSLLKFTMCPVGYCSQPMVENFPEYNSCQGNRSETLCGMCKHDYTETIYSTQCIPSDRCNDYWFWPIALVYVSLMALYLTFRPPLVPWIKRQILWFKENERVEQEIDFDKGYLKILFYFYQAADLFLISDSSRMLIKNCIIESVVGIFNFKSSFLNSSICPFPGLTPVTKRFFLTSHIVCTWLIICILYGVLCGVQRLRGKGKPSPGPYVGGILQTTLLGYTMLASTSLSLLRCVDISGERRLFFDGNIVCFQWWQYLLMGIACGYVVPFVFILLWGSIKFYGGTLSVRKLLSACFLPMPFLIYWSYMLLHDKIKGAVAENAPPSSDSRRYLEMILYDSFKRPEEGNKLSLCWESVMIGRRLILVALKSFVSDPLSRVIVMNLDL